MHHAKGNHGLVLNKVEGPQLAVKLVGCKYLVVAAGGLKSTLRDFLTLQLDISSVEGQRFQAYYKSFELPAIVVVDPITGSAMKTFTGFVSPDRSALHDFCLQSQSCGLLSPGLTSFCSTLPKDALMRIKLVHTVENASATARVNS